MLLIIKGQVYNQTLWLSCYLVEASQIRQMAIWQHGKVAWQDIFLKDHEFNYAR